MALHDKLHDPSGYLSRMSASSREKAKVANFISPDAKVLLDVGCADGTMTRMFAEAFPQANVLGIDLDANFIAAAKETHAAEAPHVQFEKVYLRELLPRKERYDAMTFISVLHEFAAYGQGISSIVKALADAHELLRPGGRIVIRDMIPAAYTLQNRTGAVSAIAKVRANTSVAPQLVDFETRYGKIETTHSLNHFLLKYFYTDNWQHECAENYMPMTTEQYEMVLGLLGMEIVHRESYRIGFLEEKWRKDFGLRNEE